MSDGSASAAGSSPIAVSANAAGPANPPSPSRDGAVPIGAAESGGSLSAGD